MTASRSLNGRDIPGSFRRLLQIPEAGADGTLRDVCDGEGDILPLRISTTAVEVTATPTTPNGVANKAFVEQQTTYDSPALDAVPVPVAQILDDHVSLRSFFDGDPLDLLSGAADAAPAFRLAALAAKAAGGMKLILPKGRLTFHSIDPLDDDERYGVVFEDVVNFAMIGQGRNQTIITGTDDIDNNIGLFTCFRLNNSHFEGFTMDGRRPSLPANGAHIFRGQGVQNTSFIEIEAFGKESGGYLFGFQNNYGDAYDSGFKNIVFDRLYLQGGLFNDLLDIKNRQVNNEGLKFSNIWLSVQGNDKAGLDIRCPGAEISNIHATMLSGTQVNAIRLRNDATDGMDPTQLGGQRTLLNNIYVVNKGATSGTGIVIDNQRVSVSNVFCEDVPIGINATTDSTYANLNNIQVRANGTYAANYGILLAGNNSSLSNFSVEGYLIGMEVRGSNSRASFGTLVSNTTNISMLNTATDTRIFAVSSVTPITSHQTDSGVNTAFIECPGITRLQRVNLDLGSKIAAQKANSDISSGNARGTYAVDLQMDRTAATEVASGLASVVMGGQRNTANAPYAVVSGFQGNARGRYGSFTQGVGGAYQSARMTLRGAFGGGATSVRLTADGSAATVNNTFISVSQGSHLARMLVTAARNNTGSGGTARDTAAWDMTILFSSGGTFPGTFVVDAVNGSLANVGVGITPNAGTRGTDPTTWTVTISADTTLGSLNVTVTTNAGKDVQCVALLDVAECVRLS